ncbi:MAG: hypothetical protein KA140_03230 [Caldisericia bacterium]|nr:hypothetical protein [Caldisericia bacterium]
MNFSAPRLVETFQPLFLVRGEVKIQTSGKLIPGFPKTSILPYSISNLAGSQISSSPSILSA